MSFSAPFRPPSPAPGSVTHWPSHGIYAQDEHLILRAETFVRSVYRFGEGLVLTGIYIGPRKIWACFAPVESPTDNQAAVTLDRASFDRWEAQEARP